MNRGMLISAVVAVLGLLLAMAGIGIGALLFISGAVGVMMIYMLAPRKKKS